MVSKSACKRGSERRHSWLNWRIRNSFPLLAWELFRVTDSVTLKLARGCLPHNCCPPTVNISIIVVLHLPFYLLHSRSRLSMWEQSFIAVYCSTHVASFSLNTIFIRAACFDPPPSFDVVVLTTRLRPTTWQSSLLRRFILRCKHI